MNEAPLHCHSLSLSFILTVAMEALFSTASSDAPISQEVLQPEDYDLAAEISQFSAFQDDWSLDQADKLKLQKLQNLDQDDSLFMSDLDANDENIKNFANDFSDFDLELESDVNVGFNLDLDTELDTNEICFALSFLTDYSRSFSRNEILEKLNLFAKDHEFALVIKTSNSKQEI